MLCYCSFCPYIPCFQLFLKLHHRLLILDVSQVSCLSVQLYVAITLKAIGFGDNYKRRNTFSKSLLIGFRIFDVEVLGVFISLIVSSQVICSIYLPSLHLRLCDLICQRKSDFEYQFWCYKQVSKPKVRIVLSEKDLLLWGADLQLLQQAWMMWLSTDESIL